MVAGDRAQRRQTASGLSSDDRVDGLEVQDRLRASGSRIPVIFITAHEDAVAQEKAMTAGAVAFIQKPFEDQVLLDAVSLGLETSGQ